MQKASAERCERNFRRSLILYSAQLRSQGSTPEEKQAARVVKYFSRNTARLFRSKIYINLQKRKLKWDVLELLKKKFLEGQKVGDVLTITSDSELSSGKDLPNAQAISCRDYLLANWLDLGSCWIKNMILEKTEVLFTMENILYLY